MTLSCRPGILVLCLAACVLTACSTGKTPARENWESAVKDRLEGQKGQFQTCGKYLPRPSAGNAHTIQMTFRVNPVGALETLWLDESSKWDQRFYDCIFNVVDSMNFPSINDHTSLEISQSLVFRTRT